MNRLYKALRSLFRGRPVYHNRPNPDTIIGFIDNYDSVDFPDFVFGSKALLKAIKGLRGARVSFLEGQVQVEIDDLKFVVSTWEELYILNEVFVDGVYNYQSSGDFVLIDIGMNVATTSLFFASKTNCLEVYSFEPFIDTIRVAEKNLQLNPKYAGKLKIHQVALGFPPRSINVEYAPKYKGSVGIRGTGSHIDNKGVLVSTNMIIEDVESHFHRILDSVSVNVVVKIDCEGAEYEILNRLQDCGMLKNDKIKGLMIEWHYDGPGMLSDILIRHDFQVISQRAHDDTIGMIYAFRN